MQRPPDRRPSPQRQRHARVAPEAARVDPRPSQHPLQPQLDEVEAVARIGSYSLDIASGRWASSRGLDAILGIGDGFERTIESWASLIHEADRAGMVAYFSEQVLGRGERFDRRYRIVRPDTRQTRWVHGRGVLEVDPAGRPVRMVGTIADVTELASAEEEQARLARDLRRSERNLAEAQRVAHIGSWERDIATGRLHWSDESHRIVGIEPGSFGGTVDAFLAFVHPEDRAAAVLRADDFGEASHRTGHYRIVRPDGAVRVVREEVELVRDDGGAPVRYVGTSQDVTEHLAAQEERDRLDERLRRSERNLAEAQRLAHIGSWEWDLLANTAQRSDELHRIYGVAPGTIAETAGAFLAFVHRDDRARITEAEQAALAGADSYTVDYRVIRPDGSIRNIHDEGVVVRDRDGRPVRMVGTVQDVTDRVAAAAERARLAAAVEHTSDAVVITDLAGTIQYVNPAFERVSGYRAEHVVGLNPRILKSGRQTAAFYRAVWRRLTSGRDWSGRFFNRRADGSLYEVEATISPIRDATGEVNGYVAVERDVTALQAARSSLASEFRERAQVAAALARLQPAGSADRTAGAICDELLGLPGVDIAMTLNFPAPAHAVPLAVRGPDGMPIAAGRALPGARAAYLYERACQGPWAEAWVPRPADGAYGQALADVGIRAAAYAPIRNGEGLLGLIAVGTRDPGYARHLIDHLPAVGEFAATATALLAGQLEGDLRAARRRAQIAEVIERRAFDPVFQPIVEIASGSVVAYEALTRFHDGGRPELRFAEAWAVGIGVELELAVLRAAAADARHLPPTGWLHVNLSPRALADPDRVRAVLAQVPVPTVVEITEHHPITDYQALRAAIRLLGPAVRTAVDDAGAGIANFAHIVELRPDFVKLDRTLVQSVQTDVGRQALIVAMRHFAEAAACRLVAEGVETAGDAETLASLGVELAQGYWYGRPERVGATQQAAVPSAARARRSGKGGKGAARG